jgi:hypothetical protein
VQSNGKDDRKQAALFEIPTLKGMNQLYGSLLTEAHAYLDIRGSSRGVLLPAVDCRAQSQASKQNCHRGPEFPGRLDLRRVGRCTRLGLHRVAMLGTVDALADWRSKSTKRCPACAEEISAAAKKCKHFGEQLVV